MMGANGKIDDFYSIFFQFTSASHGEFFIYLKFDMRRSGFGCSSPFIRAFR